MKRLLVVICCVSMAFPAYATDLSVEQCLSVLAGLNALNCVEQQLGGQCERDAKPYRLGEARYAIAMDIAALGSVEASYRKAVQGYASEFKALPPVPTDKPDQLAAERADQNKKFVAYQQNLLAGSCSVKLEHLKLSELKIGDGPDQNPIPPSVLAAFSAIVDK